MLRTGLLVAAVLQSGAAVALSGCPAPEGQAETIAAVDERLEVLLANGTRLRIWGIELPEAASTITAAARERLHSWLGAAPVPIRRLAPAPDRWGRIEAHVYGPRPGQAPLSAAEALLAAGLARLRPERTDPDCLHHLHGLEASAARRNLGLWAEARFRPLDGADRTAFAGRAGDWLIVQGRVQSMNARNFAHYINFGPQRGGDFAALIRPQVRPEVEARLGPLEGLVGRHLEVRGRLDVRFGPQIEIDLPAAVQHLDEGINPSPYSGRETRR